ncbi:MAG: general secretion pathway protein A [Cryomorphaceae bacterium]|jgi:general secretion pathway protein A
MYEGYFGLTERPFSIAPDPQYLYMSIRHKEAMAHLSYGLSQGGCFIVLTGEVGTGKTTLCRNLLGDLPKDVDVALILNANINEAELLQTVCDELKIDYQQNDSQKQLLDKINRHLLSTFADNRHTVLIIDEAQLLSRDVLEQIRLLTNLETTKSKLLQIILVGQPELNDSLTRNDLRQLAQRVTARYHLGALERNEIEEYVNHRLGVAGCKQPLFSRQALNSMHSLTEGIPRKINVLADHALLAAYAQSKTVVDAKTVKKAAKDVFIKAEKSTFLNMAFSPRWLIVIGLFLALNLFLWAWSNLSEPEVDSQQMQITENIDPTVQPFDSSGQVTVQLGDTAMSDSGEQDGDVSVAEPTILVTQARPTAESRVRGSVVIADQPLDDIVPLQPAGTQIPSATQAAPGTSDLGLMLETSADATGRTAAFRRLAEQWGVILPKKLLRTACVELSAQGIQCQGVETWQQALRFNRPTIMVIEHQTQLHRVILQKVIGDTATLQVGESSINVSVSELNNRWTKNAITFWRPGDAGFVFRQLDDRDQGIIATRQRLNQALAKSNLPLLRNAGSIEFDLDMSQKVFVLQTRFGISPDSQIGNETYLLLNEILNPEQTPMLTARAQK